MHRAEEKVLSYYDVLLRAGDVELLKTPCAWLNDQILDFYFEYLSRQHFPQPSPVAFLGTSVVFLLANSAPAELESFSQPLELASKRIVFLPINNHSDIGSPGGSHWSLLVFSFGDFFHYDSMAGSNTATARQVAHNLAMVMGNALPFVYEEVEEAPQQTNGWDCGLYVLAAVENLCEAYSSGDWKPQESCASVQTTPERASNLRERLLHIIEEKKNTR